MENHRLLHKQTRGVRFLLLIVTLMLLYAGESHAQSWDGCVIPPSGPWPPCATGGNGANPAPNQPNQQPNEPIGNENECAIPPSGPWPPCATGRGGNSTPSPQPNPQPSNNPHVQIVGNGTAATCHQTALEQAIAAVSEGGTVRFNCGGVARIGIERPVQITKDIVLDGEGVITLDGGQRTGIIETAYYLRVTFRNLTFQNGVTAGQGGALLIGYWSDLIVENSHFINNRATKDTQACDGGGAIFIGGGSVARIQNSTFSGNRANNGGAINNLRSGLTITGSQFMDNHATHTNRINQFGDCGGGGAVYVDGTRKPEDGGPDPIILSNNQYIDNTTNNEGGAIFLAVRSGEKSQISHSIFRGNHATRLASSPNSGNGGALWYGPGIGGVVNDHLQIDQSQFSQNRSEYQGGAIWVRKGKVTIKQTVINDNITINPANLGRDDWRKGIGGGIAVADNASVLLENSEVTRNHAGFVGGGIGAGGTGWVAAVNTLIAHNKTDWYQNLQQNCTHALIDRGGTRQFLMGDDASEQIRRSNCGAMIQLSAQ